MTEKLWIDDINSLFKNWDIFPTANMTKEEKLNAITRLIFITSLIFLIVGKKDISLYILLIGLIIIIVVYTQNKDTIEGFDTDISSTLYPYPAAATPTTTVTPTTCNITYYPTYVDSERRELPVSRGQNPRTLISPPLVPPIADLDAWKSSEWTTHSHINSRVVQFEDNNEPCDKPTYLTSFEPDYSNNPCYQRFSKSAISEPFIKEPFISELQPGVLVSTRDKPVLSNEGLTEDEPQGVTTLYTPLINGRPRDNLQIYVEDPGDDEEQDFHDEYPELDRAYGLPLRYTRERLPKRFGEWAPRNTFIPGVQGQGCLGVVGSESVRERSGAKEMSRYFAKNKLDMFDVDQTAPLAEVHADAVQMQIEVTNRFRANLQASLMRKRNAEQWMQKQYPIDTNQRRMLGGIGQF